MSKYRELEREAERLKDKIYKGRWSNDPQEQLDEEGMEIYKAKLEKIERALSNFD